MVRYTYVRTSCKDPVVDLPLAVTTHGMASKKLYPFKFTACVGEHTKNFALLDGKAPKR